LGITPIRHPSSFKLPHSSTQRRINTHKNRSIHQKGGGDIIGERAKKSSTSGKISFSLSIISLFVYFLTFLSINHSVIYLTPPSLSPMFSTRHNRHLKLGHDPPREKTRSHPQQLKEKKKTAVLFISLHFPRHSAIPSEFGVRILKS
jgi:hypothetical protein